MEQFSGMKGLRHSPARSFSVSLTQTPNTHFTAYQCQGFTRLREIDGSYFI
jgi:hypothetical protein